jgi:hypothetical protein
MNRRREKANPQVDWRQRGSCINVYIASPIDRIVHGTSGKLYLHCRDCLLRDHDNGAVIADFDRQ